MGCGIEVQGNKMKELPKFDINKLNFDKLIICTDADVDGMQIRCLLLTFFYMDLLCVSDIRGHISSLIVESFLYSLL